MNAHLDNLFAGAKGNQLRRVVRYLKKWKIEDYSESTPKDQLPPSIALTLMAGNGFVYRTTDGQDDDLQALYSVVSNIRNRFIYNNATGKYTISYSLPVMPWSNVFYKMSENGQDSRRPREG